MDIRVKRILDRPEITDGFRVYVERKWPLGLPVDEAEVDVWLKDLAPSEGLHSWFSDKPERWAEFERGYFEELDGKFEHVRKVLDEAMEGTVTLLHDSGDSDYNPAVAVRDYIEAKKDLLVGKSAA